MTKPSIALDSENFEIFPWSANFATGIELIDSQHQKLVALLNKLARHFISGDTSKASAEPIVQELLEYADYHFRSEEEIWHKHFNKHPLLSAHEHAHHEFFVKIQSIHNNMGELEDFVDDLFGFLTHWLAYHILDSDKRMALASLSMDQGTSLEQAIVAAENEMAGTLSTLIKAILKMYGDLSASSIELIRQRIAREKAEKDLRDANEKLVKQELSLSESRYEMLFKAIPDAVFVAELPSGRIYDVNFHATTLTGYSIAQLKSMNVLDIHPASERAFHIDNFKKLASLAENSLTDTRFEATVVHANGNEINVEVSVRGPFNFGNTQSLIGIFRDITERKGHESELNYIAYFDPLTGLRNRSGIKSDIESFIRLSAPALLVVHVDIDNFTRINQQFGTDTADKALQKFGANLALVCPDNCHLARLGGDEFLMVFEHPPAQDALSEFLTSLLRDIQTPLKLDDLAITITVSAGAKYCCHLPNTSSEVLMRQAAHALYLAKLRGKSQFYILDQAQEDQERAQNILIQQIERGLLANEFELYFQPKVNMHTGVVLGAEALIRWNHPSQGLLAPGLFLPQIEHHPVLIHIDHWVMEQALRHLVDWQSRWPSLELSINISAMSVQDPTFASRTHALFTQYQNVSPRNLQFELLESSAISSIEVAVETLRFCREIGVSIAIDDFGTGYSSLSYLNLLPIDWLKLDQSFVAQLTESNPNEAIIRSVISISEAFNFSIIAEGVETLEQGRLLIQLGCLNGQGYSISKPLPAQEFKHWLSQWVVPDCWKNGVNPDIHQ